MLLLWEEAALLVQRPLWYHSRSIFCFASATRKGDEFPQRCSQVGGERFELKRLRGVESRLGSRRLVRKRQQHFHGLRDIAQAQRPFVAVIVGRMNVLRYTLQAGDLGKGPAVLRRHVARKRSRQRAVVALDAHD